MIYCLTGTHGTGKSTLLAELKKIYPDFYFNTSATRDVTTQEERRLDLVTDTTQRKIYGRILQQELNLALGRSTRQIFMDRSFIDFTAYTEVFYKRGYVSEEFKNFILDKLQLRVRMYDRVFYLPIEFGLEDDGVRSIDKVLQQEVDTSIKNLLKSFPEAVTLTGSVDERVSQIRSSIGI